MQHSSASQESFDAPDEDPQPPEPSPLFASLRSQLMAEGVLQHEPGVFRLEHEERLRPADLLDELRDYDHILLADILAAGQTDSLWNLDTYTSIRFELSYRIWRLRLENIEGEARSVSYDLDRPRCIEVRDECLDNEADQPYTILHETVSIDAGTVERLQTEARGVVTWLIAQCPDAKLRQLQSERQKAVRAPSYDAPERQRARRFGRLSFLRWHE